ncbi:uncharacterized protein METZ01_LOCUS299084, partial [marine metagenome]
MPFTYFRNFYQQLETPAHYQDLKSKNSY